MIVAASSPALGPTFELSAARSRCRHWPGRNLARGVLLLLRSFAALQHSQQAPSRTSSGFASPAYGPVVGFIPFTGLPVACPAAVFQTAALMGFLTFEAFPPGQPVFPLGLLSLVPFPPGCPGRGFRALLAWSRSPAPRVFHRSGRVRASLASTSWSSLPGRSTTRFRDLALLRLSARSAGCVNASCLPELHPLQGFAPRPDRF